MATGPTYEGARLLLQLYDLRRERALRRARDFVNRDLKFKDAKDFNKRYPQGSKGLRHIGMVIGYWDMACALVNRGLIDEELFNAVTYEHAEVWKKLAPLVGAWRKQWQAPHALRSLEEVAKRHPAMAAARTPARNKPKTKRK
jgi:uncharacterized protein DUF4760